MFLDTSKRSERTEIMDDLEMEGDLLSRSLAKLDWINKWLGGNDVTLNGLDQLIANHPKDKVLKIVDIGSGSGDMLRLVTDKLRKQGRKVDILGMDANDFTVNYARKESAKYPEIKYKTEYVSTATFENLDYDILLGTLFLHHLKDDDIIDVMRIGAQKAKLGVVINDLNRSQVAYFLFNLLTLFIPNPMIRQDGLTSILRGFKRPDLEKYSAALEVEKYTIKWMWAFRFQWILFKKKY
ncbi:MAG: 2-polyprenyl-3-methyl-5-hydroxy-6-metoxy-1,4-benzoquinol methylase [Saprospiraceae bacterium]|jgi:2-polyprenyl-3-methyl-5-hydroxy-6-metoxy-1,4-benzoquinol methylase